MKITQYQKIAEIHNINLGSNENDVLNFWIFIESLTRPELAAYGEKYRYEYINNYPKINRAWEFSDKYGWWIITTPIFRHVPNASMSINDSWNIRNLIVFTTQELLISDKILEHSREFVFLPMFLNK